MYTLHDIIEQIKEEKGIEKVVVCPKYNDIFEIEVTGGVEDEIKNMVSSMSEDVSFMGVTPRYFVRYGKELLECSVVVHKGASTTSKCCVSGLHKELLALKGVTYACVCRDTTKWTLQVDVKGGDTDEIGKIIFKHKPTGYKTLGSVCRSISHLNFCSKVYFNYTHSDIKVEESTLYIHKGGGDKDWENWIDAELLRSVIEREFENYDSKTRVDHITQAWYNHTGKTLWVVGETPVTIVVSGDFQDFDKFEALCHNSLEDGIKVSWVPHINE